eukprot:TRINITY_DN1374_c0_g1_i1.p1 TRINITY_DN1374_c0_g1~~TRINITY_DN1374_c0_g1_i1.p1  ORF type:complete len:307 (-),score=144.35 TRINITY_DN1374_c0_g1_i1:317-1237(-)
MSKNFGVPLEEIMKRPGEKQVPSVLRKLFTFLNTKEHISTEGLFRVSAGVKELSNLIQALDSGDDVNLSRQSSHLIAGLLKSFFIELPEPLFTFDLYESFVSAADHPDCRNQLRSNLERLPVVNRLVASCLFLFLHRVCDFSEQNKMTSKNLAIVFGQILLRPRIESLELLRHAPKISDVLKIMIDEYYELFPRSKEDERLLSKGELTSIDVLVGIPPKKKKTKKRKKDRDEVEDLSAEQQKLRNVKNTVDDAIDVILQRLDSLAEQLETATSMEETIVIAKRIRSAKRVLSTVPLEAGSGDATVP